MEQPDANILCLLIAHESAVGRLYEAFASAPIGHEDLWRNLAADERQHARALASARSLADADRCFGLEGAAKPAAVRSSINYVEDQTARAQEGGINPVQALAIGADLENALIERQFLKPGGSACLELRHVLEELEADTKRHRETLLAALEEERRTKDSR